MTSHPPPFFWLALMLTAIACGSGTTTETTTATETPAGVAEPGGAPALTVQTPRAHLMPDMGAVYFSIVNDGGEGDRLLAIETAAAAAAETHESVEDEGVMRMVARPDGFEIPAAGTLTLEPGGKHIMLIEPQPPAEAPSIQLTLRFEKSAPIELEVPVEAPGGMDSGPEHAHDREAMHPTSGSDG